MLHRPIQRLLAVTSCLLFFYYPISYASSLEEQRSEYKQAKQALDKGNPNFYYSYKNSLKNYPLLPYLTYLELNNRINTASDDEIKLFIKQHKDLPQASWLEMRWLRNVAKRGDWATFLEHYKADSFSELDCYYAQYLYQQKHTLQANQLAEKLWLKPRSQPNACDAVFDSWQRTGKLTNSIRWERLKLVLEEKDYRLAAHIVNEMPFSLRAQSTLFLNVAKNPSLIVKTSQFQTQNQNKETADMVSLGLRRLARIDPEQALSLLNYYGVRLHFSRSSKTALANDIGLIFARRFDPRALPIMAQYDSQLDHDDVSQWHVRLLLRLQRWREAYQLIQKLPPTLAQTTRWRYWKARTLQLMQPDSQEAMEQYKALASERDFYAFLAAQRVHFPYTFNDQPIKLSPHLINNIKNKPNVQRAFEFEAVGQPKEAWGEWSAIARHFSEEDKLALAKAAYEMQSYFLAIRTLAMAQYWDDLTIRFPMAYRPIILQEAAQRDISPNWVFAIVRQESAFKWDIKSPVGAMGLMQLMPGTAKETAKKDNIPLSNVAYAINPKTNIQLGTAFLSRMYHNLQSNRILASAAYNAGPGRVKQWLKDASHLTFDVWIETIPFNETRQYVQNVLFYSVIYGHKLDKPQDLIEPHEMQFMAQ